MLRAILFGDSRRTHGGARDNKEEWNLFTFFRNLIFLAVATTLGAASASAEIAVQVYDFTGECTDCTGTGIGTLILLADYTLGTPLSADDLYSFNYSSNLIPSDEISGILPVGLGPANISISGSERQVQYEHGR